MKDTVKYGRSIKIYQKGKHFSLIILKEEQENYTNIDIISQHLLEKNIQKFFPTVKMIFEEELEYQLWKQILDDSEGDYKKYFLTDEEKREKDLDNFISRAYSIAGKLFYLLFKTNVIFNLILKI